jgi:hypothetical protein
MKTGAQACSSPGGKAAGELKKFLEARSINSRFPVSSAEK